MGKINAGDQFGQDVASPQRLNEVALPRAAFGVTTGLARAGQQMEAEGLQRQREADQQVQQWQRENAQAQDAADRARASARLGALRDRLQDMTGEIDTEVQGGAVEKGRALDVWRERSAKVLEDGLEQIPEAHRGIAQETLNGWAERLTSNVQGSVKKRNQSDTRADLNTTLEHLQRVANTDPERARLQMTEALDGLGPAAGLMPDQIGKAKQSWVETTSYTRAFTAVNGAKNDNRALSAVEQALQGNQDIDPQRKAGLLAQVDGYKANNEAKAIRAAQRAEINAAKVERESSSAYTVLSDWARAGKAADPTANAGLIAKLTPAHAAAYRAVAAEVPARTAVAMLPISAQQQRLDGLMAQRNANGTSDGLEREITRTEQVLKQARTDYDADPLRAGAERGVIDKVQPLDMSSLDALGVGIAQRVEQAKAVGTRTERPVSPLLPEEASRVGDMLAALPLSERSKRIAQIAGLMPLGMSQAIAAQIDKKDRALGLQFAAGTSRTTEGRYTAELIARGAQALADVKGGSVNSKGDMMRQQLRADVLAYVGDALTGKAREDVIDAALLIDAGLGAVGSKQGARHAVGIAVGGDVIEHNGRRIPVPAGVGDLRAQLKSLPPTAIAQQSDAGTVYAGGRGMPVADFMAGLPDAQLEPAGMGRYFVRSGGGLVTGKDRRPIVVGVQ